MGILERHSGGHRTFNCTALLRKQDRRSKQPLREGGDWKSDQGQETEKGMVPASPLLRSQVVWQPIRLASRYSDSSPLVVLAATRTDLYGFGARIGL